MRGGLLGPALSLVLVLGVGSAAVAQEADGAAGYQQACASCHQADGTGIPGAFPPLAGNPNVADPAYVTDVIRNGKQGPITVDGETYDGVMPAVTTLSDAQIAAVAAYVAGLAGGGPTTTPTTTPGSTPAQPIVGDPVRGEDLMVGRTGLAGGGGACVSCHAVGPYGGATLGPDLTAAFSRLGGEVGLTGWLAAPPSLTMQPAFAQHPLDPGEIADIVAYLGSVDGTSPDRGPDVMLIGGAVGLVALFAVMALLFKRPRGRYVDHLRSKA